MLARSPPAGNIPAQGVLSCTRVLFPCSSNDCLPNIPCCLLSDLVSLVSVQVFAAVLRHVDWGIVKCLVIAGPGFAKDSFKTYLDAEAVKRDVRPLIENKASIFTAPVSWGCISVYDVCSCDLDAACVLWSVLVT